jgi:glycine/serine hydroxymethyltransferase
LTKKKEEKTTMTSALDLNASLAQADEEIFGLIVEEQKRQINCLEFIASEVRCPM